MPAGGDGWYPRSFLLTDIVGSVSLWERDPEAMARAVARHDAIVGREVLSAGGVVVRSKGEGDSTFAVFAHPAQAVAAALALQAAIEAQDWRTAAPLRVRAGVHTGDAEPRDGDWYGPAVNRAARLRALAEGGQTLLSGVTAGLVADQMPPGVRLLYRGRRALRGIERPEEVWELVAANDPRLAAPRPAKGALPVALTRFVGLTVDIEHLVELIEAERLVTLTGPGGSGKTRLALEVGRHAAGRGEAVWLAELAPLRDGALVAEAVAAAVGVETGPDPLDDLAAQAEALTGVLVLDNCEHLLDACAALAQRLLTAAPDLRVLATSREPLGLAGEREWAVRPLDVPDESLRDPGALVQVESVQLLLDRARAVRPDLEVGSDDVASVVDICRALHGMPLALELAAGRLRSLSLTDLAARLDDQLTVLVRHRSASRNATRHRTLRLTLDWSYDLLSDQQRTLSRRLSVFAGGFRLDAAETVCGDLDVFDGVDELVAKSLVTFDGATARYRLLEPLRQYLAARLDESGEAEVIRRAHAQWVTALCDRLGNRPWDDRKALSRRLHEEAGNIELALRWAHELDHAMAARIVGALGPYWFFHDPASGRRWCDAVIELRAGVARLPRAGSLLSAGMIAQNDRAWTRSTAWLREALAIYRAAGDAAGQAASLHWLGRALANWSDPDQGEDHAIEAARCFEASLELFTRLGDRVGAGWCRILLTSLAFWNDDLARAEQLATQVVQDCSPAGVRHPLGQALSSLGYVTHRRGDDATALEFLHDAVACYRDLDDLWQLANVLIDLAAQEAAMDRGADALQALAESTEIGEQIGRLQGRSFRLAVAAFVHLIRGDNALSISALGAYDAHPAEATERARPGIGGGYVGWLVEEVEATRAQLNPAEVAAATRVARRKSLDELIDMLIIQPAKAPL